MKAAMERARELDQLCAETDIQLVLHVVAPPASPFGEEQLGKAAEEAGMTLESDGRYALRAEDGRIVYTMGDASPEGLTLSLDVPHAPDTRRSFESMTRLARQLAASCGGSVADDNGNALGDAALEAIAVQLDEVRGVLEARGIAPGGPVASRLFS
jgi:FtsZ-interacting cell division protein ZipA